MEINIEIFYLNDTVFGKLLKYENQMLLLKTFSSVEKCKVLDYVKNKESIGYSLIGEILRFSKTWVAQVGRIVPIYQRLISHDAFEIEIDENGKEIQKYKKVFTDIIIYTDEDLERMRDFNKKSQSNDNAAIIETVVEGEVKNEYIVYPNGERHKLESRHLNKR